MAKTWRDYCDDIIQWVLQICGLESNREIVEEGLGGRIGSGMMGEWFPPAPEDDLLIHADERGEGVTENRESDPKLVITPDSTTHAVINGNDSIASNDSRRNLVIEWLEECEI
jgi:hypothetical protein